MKITAIGWLAFLFLLSNARLDAADTACKRLFSTGVGMFSCESVVVATPEDVATSTNALDSRFNQKLADSTMDLDKRLTGCGKMVRQRA